MKHRCRYNYDIPHVGREACVMCEYAYGCVDYNPPEYYHFPHYVCHINPALRREVNLLLELLRVGDFDSKRLHAVQLRLYRTYGIHVLDLVDSIPSYEYKESVFDNLKSVFLLGTDEKLIKDTAWQLPPYHIVFANACLHSRECVWAPFLTREFNFDDVKVQDLFDTKQVMKGSV